MTTKTAERFRIVERRQATAPALPTDRPPTKREAWDHYSHVYGDVKTQAELRPFVKEAWAWAYVQWWREKNWRKQPDWTPGEAVLEDCVPHAITVDNWNKIVHECWNRAHERGAA